MLHITSLPSPFGIGDFGPEAYSFARLLGFPDLRRRAAAAMRPEETALLQAYVDGVNAYIRQRGDDLPLEFRSAAVAPAPWKVEDVFSFIALNSWMFRENYRAELLALAARREVQLEEWKDIFPAYPGAVIPDDPYFEALRDLMVSLKIEKSGVNSSFR